MNSLTRTHDDPHAAETGRSGMKIADKMLAGYAILVVLAISVVSYVLVSLYQINRLNVAIVTVDIPIRNNAGKMIDALIAQSGYEKRYLILRGSELHRLFLERGREFDILQREIEGLSHEIQPAVRELGQLHDEYARLFTTMADLLAKGRVSAAQSLSQGRMNDLIDRMLEVLRAVPRQAQLAHDARMRRIQEVSSAALRNTFLLCLITTATSVLAALLLTFSITSSIRRLKTATVRIAEGKFDVMLQMDTPDEVGELARAFDGMTRRLKKLEAMYLDASPLTRLPGGVAIERVIQRRLEQKEPMALCVIDLDNFKAFNDRYGYAHGNVVIKEAARIIEQSSRSRGAPDDFVGHVGGDDFVVVTKPDRIQEICGEIIAQFDRNAPGFYNAEDREKGYIFGKTRQGVEMKFPLLTVSIAVVTNALRNFSSPVEMSEVAAELKEYAKQFARSIYVVDKRRK